MQLPNATVTVTVSGLEVTVTTDKPAMWVMLTTAAHGRFEDNAFLLRKGSRTLQFVAFVAGQEDSLRDTIRVEHVAQHVL